MRSKISKRGKLNGLRVAPHYGCHFLRPRKHRSVDRVLHEIVYAIGGEPVDYREENTCCGAGGGVRSAEKELSLKYTLRKIESMREARVDCLVSPCIFCHLQFDVGQRELYEKRIIDRVIPVVHITQLVGLALGLKPEEVGLNKNYSWNLPGGNLRWSFERKA